jgi:hypothetical protein
MHQTDVVDLNKIYNFKSRDNSVDVALGYGLDDWDSRV